MKSSKRNAGFVLVLGLLVAVALGLFRMLTKSESPKDEPRQSAQSEVEEVEIVSGAESATAEEPPPEAASVAQGTNPSEGPEELEAAASVSAADTFDELTDSWLEPKDVSVKDADAFARALADVPKDRQKECLQRALNLIPEENTFLLISILTDKSLDRELVTMVFNDILNRDEALKKPILELVYKDKTHPCREDAVWILEKTAETPDSGRNR